MKSETLTISLEKSTQDSIPFYSPSQPFGFVDEAAHNAQPSLNIFELNSGFNVPYWYASEPITQIQQDENGCFLDSDALVQTLWERMAQSNRRSGSFRSASKRLSLTPEIIA